MRDSLSKRCRWSLLQREISCHKPDIVTLQEVQCSREEDIFNNDLVPWFTKVR